MMVESWLPVEGYEGRYEVSNLGRVKSLPNSRRKGELILCQQPHVKSGHRIVNLTRNEGAGYIQKSYYVHLLVLKAFVGPCPAGLQGCHNNGDPSDNAKDNLRWDTVSANQMDRVDHGTSNRGAANGQAVLVEDDVKDIKRRLANKETQTSIAKFYKVSRSAILQIHLGKNWSWI